MVMGREINEGVRWSRLREKEKEGKERKRKKERLRKK